MKTSLLLMLCLCLTTIANAQTSFIHTDSVYLIGNNQQGFSVVVKGLVFPNACNLSGITLITDAPKISLSCCYYIDESYPEICQRTDTLTIGTFLPNDYQLKIVLLTFQSDCGHPTHTDTTIINFSTALTGINQLPNNIIMVYPNPASNKLSCTLSQNPKQARYFVTSVDGKQVIDKTAIPQPHFEVDVSQLASGLYYLIVQDDKQQVVKQFTKY